MSEKNDLEENENQADSELISKGKRALDDFDQSEPIVVPAKSRESKLISIRIPIGMMQKLRSVALAKGDIGYQQIIKTYIAEGLRKDLDESRFYDAIIQTTVLPTAAPFYEGVHFTIKEDKPVIEQAWGIKSHKVKEKKWK
jgi:hypothetical protein